MRIKVLNQSSRPDEDILPLAEYAATFFPHRTGVVQVTIKNTRTGYHGNRPHSVCCGGCRCTVWVEPPGKEMTYPRKQKLRSALNQFCVLAKKVEEYTGKKLDHMPLR